MPTDNDLFMIPILCGVIFVLAGIIMRYSPPKKINSLYGYRTRSSMKNQERWDFAQQYSSKYLMKFGVLLALSGGIGFFYHPDENIALGIGFGLLLIIVIALYIRVEAAIKKKFKNS